MLVAALIAGPLALRCALAQSVVTTIPHGEVLPATSLPGLMDWFAVGIGLAVLAAEWEAGSRRLPRLARLSQHPWRCWSLASVCFLVERPTHRLVRRAPIAVPAVAGT
jgi:hypothetical protein